MGLIATQRPKGFIRELSTSNIEQLRKHDLFRRLEKDKDIFPAIRLDYLNFYYRGCSLFTWRSGQFSSHQKFLADWSPKDYVSEKSAGNIPLFNDFGTNFSSIKRNALVYASEERESVGCLATKGSYLHHPASVVVLDVEIAFQNHEDHTQDKLDLLLFDTNTRQLKFIEAKSYSNKDIWASEGNKAKVFYQIERYQQQLGQRRNEVLQAYQQYVAAVNELFGIGLPKPEGVEEDVNLLVFNFDGDQRNGQRFQKHFLHNPANSGYRYYAVGDPRQADLLVLFKGKSFHGE